MNNTISVIIPTFNRVDFLIEAINSVFAQTYPITELIIINDSSTDNTELIVKEYQNLHPKIIYLKNDKNKESMKPENFKHF